MEKSDRRRSVHSGGSPSHGLTDGEIASMIPDSMSTPNRISRRVCYLNKSGSTRSWKTGTVRRLADAAAEAPQKRQAIDEAAAQLRAVAARR